MPARRAAASVGTPAALPGCPRGRCRSRRSRSRPRPCARSSPCRHRGPPRSPAGRADRGRSASASARGPSCSCPALRCRRARSRRSGRSHRSRRVPSSVSTSTTIVSWAELVAATSNAGSSSTCVRTSTMRIGGRAVRPGGSPDCARRAGSPPMRARPRPGRPHRKLCVATALLISSSPKRCVTKGARSRRPATVRRASCGM